MPRTLDPQQHLGPLNELEVKQLPPSIFVEGDASLLAARPKVAIVGSRNASPAGLERATKLATWCARNGVVVVSGLAAGIDTAAHTGAMEAGGRTIAVLGTPLDRTFPKQNRQLQRDIAAGHLLVSQFAQGTAGGPGNFPQRNKLMVFIADVLVVVEAAEQSGTRDQAWAAIRVRRPVLIARSLLEKPDVSWPKVALGYGAEELARVGDLKFVLDSIAPSGTAAATF